MTAKRSFIKRFIVYTIIAAFIFTQNTSYAGILKNDTLRPVSSVANGTSSVIGNELGLKTSSSGLTAAARNSANYRDIEGILSVSVKALKDRGVSSPGQMIEKMLAQYVRGHYATPDDVILGINPDNVQALRDLYAGNAKKERGPPEILSLGGGGGFLYVTLKALTKILGKLVYGSEPGTDSGGSSGNLSRTVYPKKGYTYGVGDHVNGVTNALYQPSKLGVLDYRPVEKTDTGKSMRQIVIEQIINQIKHPMFEQYEANLLDAPDFLIFVANLLNVADIIDEEFVADKINYPGFSLAGHSIRNLYAFAINHKLGVFPDGGYDANAESVEENAKIASYILEKMLGVQIEDPASPHMFVVSLGESISYLTFEDPIPEQQIQSVGENNPDIRGHIMVNGENSPFGPKGSVTVFGQRFIDQIQHNSKPIKFGLVRKVTPNASSETEVIGGSQVNKLSCDLSAVDTDISHLRPTKEFMESVNAPGLEAITIGAGTMFSSLACQLACPGVVEALMARKNGFATIVKDGRIVQAQDELNATKNILVFNHVAMDETNGLDFLAQIKMFEDIMTEAYNYGKPEEQWHRIRIGDVFSHIIVNNTIAALIDSVIKEAWSDGASKGSVDARYEPLRRKDPPMFVDEYGIRYYSPIFVAEGTVKDLGLNEYFWVPDERGRGGVEVIRPKPNVVQDASGTEYKIKTNEQGDDVIDIPGVLDSEKPRIIYKNRYVSYLLDTADGRQLVYQHHVSFDDLQLLSYLDHDNRLYSSRSERGRFRGPIYATKESLEYLKQNGISANNIYHTDSLLSMQQKIIKASGVLQFDRFAGLDASKVAAVLSRILDPKPDIIAGIVSGDITARDAAARLIGILREDISQKQAIGEMLYDLYATSGIGPNAFDNVIDHMFKMLVGDAQSLHDLKDISLAVEKERLVAGPNQIENLARLGQQKKDIMLAACGNDQDSCILLAAVNSVYMAIQPSPKPSVDVYNEINKKQDVRGNAQSQLTDEVVGKTARAFAEYLKRKTGKPNPSVAIGKDTRLSSPHIMRVLVENLTKAGIRVINVGHPYCSTPMVTYAMMLYKDIDAGIMISASHLESKYNGMKFLLRSNKNPEAAVNLSASDLKEILDMAKRGEGAKNSRIKGGYEIRSVLPEYKALLVNRARRIAGTETPLEGKLIAVDSGSGVGGFFADVLRKLGANVEALNTVPDGTYPAHLPNPDYAWCMVDLAAGVRQVHADLGVAFDSDGDRTGFVDNKGTRITGNKLITFLSSNLIAEHPNGYITTNVRGTQAIADMINAITGKTSDDFIVGQGANVEISDVHRSDDGRIMDYMVKLKDISGKTVTTFKVEGHTIWTELGYVPIKQLLDWLVDQNVSVISATETSGHIMWTDMNGLDDGMYTAATVLSLVAKSGQPMSTHMDRLLTYEGPEDTLRLDATDGQRYLDNITAMLQDIENAVNGLGRYDYVIDSIDGKRFIFTDKQGNFVARVLFRPSLTQPFIGFDLEARSAEEAAIIARAFLEQISENPSIYPIDVSPLRRIVDTYQAKSSSAGYGIQKQTAMLKQVVNNNTKSYWDAVSVIVKRADAKYVVDSLEAAKGQVVPENASIVLVDKDTDPAVLSRLFSDRGKNGTTSVIVYVIEDDIEGNLSATMDNIRKVRQAGFDFENQHMLIVLAGGEAKRSWPGVASDGMGNKGLMASVNGRPNLYQALAESMQIYDAGVKGVVVMPTDRLMAISSQLTALGQKDIQLVGSSMNVEDRLLAFYGKVEVADDGTLVSMPSRSDIEANERLVQGKTHVPSNNLTVWYASSRGIAGLLERLDPADKNLNTIQDIFKKPSTFNNMSIGYVDAGRDTLFAEIGDNTHLYETLQQLFESEYLRNLLGVRITESGAIIADTVRLGSDVVVEPGAIVLGHTTINSGIVRSGAAVIDSIINVANIASNSLVIAAEERNTLSTETQDLVSDVRIKDAGLSKVIRVRTKISANPKDVWWQQIWQGYSYEQLKDLLDRDATAMFLAHAKSSSAGNAQLIAAQAERTMSRLIGLDVNKLNRVAFDAALSSYEKVLADAERLRKQSPQDAVAISGAEGIAAYTVDSLRGISGLSALLDTINQMHREGSIDDINGTIVINESEIPSNQQILVALLSKGNPYHTELENKIGCKIRLHSEFDSTEDSAANMIAISSVALSKIPEAKRVSVSLLEADGFLPLEHIIVLAKGLLVCNKDNQNALGSLIAQMYRIITKQKMDPGILTQFIENAVFILYLPAPLPIDRDYYQNMHKQIMAALIAA